MKKIALSLSILVAFVANAMAQPSRTEGLLSTNAETRAVWTSGDSALMGYNKALYRTTNGGETWEILTNGIPFDADPRVISYINGNLFVATNDKSRMYISNDFGDSFTANSPSPMLVPIAGTTGSDLYMIGGTIVKPHLFNFASSTWTPIEDAYRLTWDIQRIGKDSIWMCTGGANYGKTMYSHDNGTTWKPIENEPQTDVGGGIIMKSPTMSICKVGTRILVGTTLNKFPILYTDDYGKTWNKTNSKGYQCQQLLKVNDNLILARIGGKYAGAIYKSTDQGLNWEFMCAAKGEMAIWKGDKLLTGNLEYDNYGQGDLIKTHGVPAATAKLTDYNGRLLTAVSGKVWEFNPNSNEWKILVDSVMIGNFKSKINAQFVYATDNTIYVLTSYDVYESKDGGNTFVLSDLRGGKYSFMGKFGNRLFMASCSKRRPPSITYSDDGGTTLKTAKFTNNIAYGRTDYLRNYLEKITISGMLGVADFLSGYAITKDGGETWTFYKGTWDDTSVTIIDGVIYLYNNDLMFGTKTFEYSEDQGEAWQSMPEAGFPIKTKSTTNKTASSGYYGAWNLDEELYTFNNSEETRGFYKYDKDNATWSLVENTELDSVKENESIIDVLKSDDKIYTVIANQGVWVADVSGGGNTSTRNSESNLDVKVFPNPSSTGQVTIEAYGEFSYEVFNSQGTLVSRGEATNAALLNSTGKSSGLYLVRVVKNNQAKTIKLTIR